MPTYQYRCLNCAECFELKQSFSDKPVATCPLCHEVARRIFSPVPILFKGPGFYITDCRAEESAAKGLNRKGKETDEGGDKS